MDYTEAERYYRNALEIYKGTDEKTATVDVYNQLCWIFIQKREFNKAEENA